MRAYALLHVPLNTQDRLVCSPAFRIGTAKSHCASNPKCLLQIREAEPI